MDNEAHPLFDKFLQGRTCRETLSLFQDLCRLLCLDPTDYCNFYNKLKGSLNYWKAKALWVKLDKRAAHNEYEQGQACLNTKCLVLGCGPCGLRTAIELAFLGAKVLVVEKRDDFSRNNVLHLWPFTIQDLRGLGAKKFYGKFCSGSLDHVSIRQLQLILLKVALILGVEIHVNVEYKGLIEPPKDKRTGWRAHLLPAGHPVADYQFDVFVSAGGGKYVPEGFKKKEMRGKLAIGITANFVNKNSAAEAKVQEINGVAYLYNQKFFQQLHRETGIDLENIVYYKDDTHYFVMTARKTSLLKYGVIREDKQDADSLLSARNVNSDNLLLYAREAADFCTENQLPNLEFATNHQNRPDVAMFDFTCMFRSENSALVKERQGRRLLVALVGDCLVEPFWPLGTGIARGFLAAFDAAWSVRKWSKGIAPVEILAERESIYQLLSQTTPDNTSKKISQYSIDPLTRYRHLNLSYFKPHQVQHLYDTGQTTEVEDNNTQTKGKMLRNDSVTGYEELLNWLQIHTDGYKNVTVVDLTTSWKSGLALCALVHHFRPDLIDFESLKEESVAENNELAFNIAENQFGISPIMTGREMASLSRPDKLGMVMYLAQFNEFFKTLSPEQGVHKKLLTLSSAKSALVFLSTLRRSVANKRSSLERPASDHASENKRSKAEAGASLAEDSTESLDGQATVESPWVENAKAQTEEPEESVEGSLMKGDGPSSSEVCYLCKQRVYLVERFSAEGQFFHRGCFTCHNCGTTLRPGNYAFNGRDGKLYCTVHYADSLGPSEEKEEKSASPNKDVVDGKMEWCRSLEKIEYGKDNMDEGLQGFGEIGKQGDEESKVTEKEHSSILGMRLLTPADRNPSQNMEQASVSQSVAGGRRRPKHEPGGDPGLAAGSGRDSSDYKNIAEAAEAEYERRAEECPAPPASDLTAASSVPPSSVDLLPSLDGNVGPAGHESKLNAEGDGTFETGQMATSEKVMEARLESPIPEPVPSHPGKPLHMDNANGTLGTASYGGVSTNEQRSLHQTSGPTASPRVKNVNIKVIVEDTGREAECGSPPAGLSSVNTERKPARDQERIDGPVPRKKLSLSAGIRRRLARLSVTSESDSDGEEGGTSHSTGPDDKISLGNSAPVPSICLGAEFPESGWEQEIPPANPSPANPSPANPSPANPSPAPRSGDVRSADDQEWSQVYWDSSGPALKNKSSPNAVRPLHENHQLDVAKKSVQREKPKETGSGSQTLKSKLNPFSKVFSRISKREKKSKEPASVAHLPNAETPISQVSSVPEEEVKSCDLNGDEESDEDEEESSSEDELECYAEPLPKIQLSPAEAAAKRETWQRRTIDRRAKQGEMARFMKAQMIQRRLEEIAQLYHELEQKGILLEKELRRGTGDLPQMMQSWFTLVQDKNKLLNEESELMFSVRELELQDQKCRLEQDLRRYMDMDASLKTKEDQVEEERIFREMIEVVRMRDRLVAVLEEQRLQEMEQHAVLVPSATAKDLSTRASITWT
ncbi:F-actin-monooxygenase mical1-like isoform X1 [Rhinoraja longicauda]